MQFTFFTTLSSKLSTFLVRLQKSLSFEENTASKNPLYPSFNLYIKEDLSLALELMKNGYEPSRSQMTEFNKSMVAQAVKSDNFLYHYSKYIDYIPQEAVVRFCVTHDLGHVCQNKKSIFNNFTHVFKHFLEQDNFSENLYSAINSSIFNDSLKIGTFKPKYEYVHCFELNHVESRIFNRFKSCIYNSLVLIPYMVKDIDQFVSLRTTIEKSVDVVEKLVQSNNVRITNMGGTDVHYNKTNRAIFNLELLNGWVEFMRKYDTTKLQADLMAKLETLKKSQTNDVKNPEVKTIVDTSKVKNQDNIITIKMKSLKSTLSNTHQEQIGRIENLYSNIKNDMFEKKDHYELDSLYNDLPSVVEKFISIHSDYRDSLKNVEGKSPEQLMVESLTIIESKFQLYWEDINQNKVTDLSIVGRTIKMKA